MSSPPDNRRPLAAVDAAFRSLPDRYLGANPGFDATYHIRLGDLGHIWEVRCTGHAARVRKGGTRRQPDVTISTDSDTWMRLRQGEFSGIEAFERRLLRVRGNLDYAVGFEGMFRLPNGRPPLLQIRDVPVGRHRISTMTMGYGPDVLLLHGLGSTRASLFETAAALSTNYRVHAPDLPASAAVGDLIVDEFRRIYHSAGARYAFLASARNIYLEAPFGRNGFSPRLSELRPPALFVWGSHDRLVPHAFSRHVRKWLPGAEQVTIDSCGHVPQVERPEPTNALLSRFFAEADGRHPAIGSIGSIGLAVPGAEAA